MLSATWAEGLGTPATRLSSSHWVGHGSESGMETEIGSGESEKLQKISTFKHESSPHLRHHENRLYRRGPDQGLIVNGRPGRDRTDDSLPCHRIRNCKVNNLQPGMRLGVVLERSGCLYDSL